jgi:hypothetical protein
MKKILHVSDLDGTLLDKSSKVPEYTEEVINEMIDRGMNFSIATARSWNSSSKILKNIKMTLPVITYNGAFIVDPNTGNILQSNCMEKEYAEYALKEFIKNEIYPLVYAFIDGEEKVSWCEGKENEGISYYLSQRKGDKRFNPITSVEDLLKGDIFYITAIGFKDELEKINDFFENKKYFSNNFQQELYRPEYWLEIKRFDATKGDAVEKVKKMTNCEKIISFGDSVNDIPMFVSSDESYAVSNAVKELIEKSTGIIDVSENNGVAKWMQQMYRE